MAVGRDGTCAHVRAKSTGAASEFFSQTLCHKTVFSVLWNGGAQHYQHHSVDFVRNPVTCGRITGKGFGRCLYAIMREGDIENFRKKIVEFEKIFGFHPDVYEIEPSDGACIVKD